MDRYVRVKKVGEGSFGKALLVKRKSNGRQYVIKEINISKMSPKEREESRKEVKVLAQLRHPNIVSYEESFEENGNLYIVMDYCEGGDLYKRINSQRGIQFSEETVMDYFVQICLAMKHVHDRKILHRDLKSQNIFLTKSGIVKLGDFGIARVLHSTMELARTCIGTPYYLSPEICENRPYNNKSDIWSLGCVLYELLTLKHAFEAGNMKNLVFKIIRGSYPPIPLRYTADIRGLLAQLLKRNPHDRPSVNSILKKPFIQKRIEKFLSDEVLAEEFSHTVIHRKPLGVLGQRGALPKASKPVPAQQKYSDPKAKYGVSVAKKKPALKKPNSAEPPRKPAKSEVSQVKPGDKKKELDARERRRKEMMQNQEQMYQDYMRKVQQQRWERQKREQINRAREHAWKATLNVGLSPDKEKKPSNPPAAFKPNQQEVLKKQLQPMQKYQVKGDDNKSKENKSKENKPARPLSAEEPRKAPAVQVAGRPVSANEANRGSAHHGNAAWDAAKRGEADRALGAGAAEKARLVEDFWNRKREAARNKARGQNFNALPDHYYPAQGDIAPKQGRKVKGSKEKEYLARLEAIRRQNFLERQEIQKRMAAVRVPVDVPRGQKENVIPGDPRYDPEARRKKIAALKAQAEERAVMLRAQLEERKKAVLAKMEEEGKERMEKEKHRVDTEKRPLPALAKYQRPAEPPKPTVPLVGLETALKEVGANKLFRSSSEGDLSKILQEEAEPLAPRKVWGDVPFKPRVLPLEVTASAMEATSAEDAVKKPGMGPPRKHWGQTPKKEIIAALGNAKLQTATTAIGSGDEPDAGKRAQLPVVMPSSETTPTSAESPAMGVTVTVPKRSTSSSFGVTLVKSPTSPKTFVAKKDDNETCESSPNQATITMSEKTPSPKETALSLETISERINEVEPDGKLNENNSEELNFDDVADVTEDSGISAPLKEKPAPKSPIKAWGEEVKASTPTEAPSESPRSPREECSLAANRAAYQEFLNASRKSDENEEKEALFERVERKDEKETNAEDLEVQDLSFDDLSFHTADGSPSKSRRAEELQTGIYDTIFTRLRTCSLPNLRMLFETSCPGHAESPEDEDEDGAEDEDDAEGERGKRDEEDGEIDEDDDALEELAVESDEEESEEFEDMLQSMRDVLVSTGRSPSPMKSFRGNSGSLDWDHCGDTRAPQGDESDGVQIVRSSSELSNLNEDWDSGDEDDDGDPSKKDEREKKRLEDEESVFHRLEESRLMLEQELGIDKFLRVYKFLQAVQENEDDSAEVASAGEIGELLGDKEHLYPKILYLVIADSAYSEDNQ